METKVFQTQKDAFDSGVHFGLMKAIEALRSYNPETEEIRCCMHSPEWAAWLESKFKIAGGNDGS
jgi:hypothetical protein